MATTPRPDPPLPSPPFIHIEGLPNFRDIGGYPITTTTSGGPGPAKKMVRRGLVYRSSEPSRLTDQGVAKLQQLGVAKVYDLRSEVEVSKAAAAAEAAEAEQQQQQQQQQAADRAGTEQKQFHHAGTYKVKEWEGAERVFVPVFLDEDYSPEAMAVRFKNFAHEGAEGFVRAYTRILDLGAQESHPHQPFRTILSHLAQPPSPPPPPPPTTSSSSPSAATAAPPPILIHCTAGKDRTGVIIALLLSLAGVPDEAVAHEYSLTDAGLADRKEEFVAGLLRSAALQGDREGASRMVSSRRENMLATLALIREKYGSVEQYVERECGLSADQVAQLRRNLTVDADEHVLDWEGHAEAHQKFVAADKL
ncbi:uncharacterized protein E0L32_009097 [Thyridium curvatum]|uniref:Tyrosine specific protein phosphatases domain-containing protein n=1 Tax=Thyridium curvatum TaxID=1093900 RepID=A0A507AY65_9PEZI|nr:uncharacterized protein E0L32_009097 [Thyridium curvatum]TPX09758.1 hypothetical protein E0L32_009097 [Thyridium curvatum]